MWVSSLVVALSDQAGNGSQVITALQSISALTVGEAIGRRIPVVIEAGPHDSRHWHDWIVNLPGVSHVEVAFVSFEDVQTPQGGPSDDL